MRLSNRTYDVLKTIAFIIAPLLTFASAVCIIWNVPYSEQITATLAALDTMLGALLKNSTDIYRAETPQSNFNEDYGSGLEVEVYEDQDTDTEKQ